MSDLDVLLRVIRSRRSIRRFTADVPAHDRIESLIETACWAPSAHDRQAWKFVVFRDPERIRDLARSVHASLTARLANAPDLLAQQGKHLLGYAAAFAAAPVLILAMHKRSPASTSALLDHAATPLASGEALSAAMAVQNLLLAAHAAGLGACVHTAPLFAGDVWNALPDLPHGFEPTCLVTLGFPDETPPAPPRKPLQKILEFR